MYALVIWIKIRFKELSKCHQCRLQKELETSALTADPSTNPNWNQSSGNNFHLGNKWSKLDSDSEIVASNSEDNFDRYLDVNENNLAVLNISQSCLVFP